MGSIRKYEGKRGVSWVIDYVSPDGRRVRQSFKTRKEAKAELTARDYTIQQGTYEDPRKYQKVTLEQLCDQYEEIHKTQSGYEAKKYHIKNIRQYFGDDRLLITIKYKDLDLFKAHLEQTPTKHKRLRKPATVNRALSCLRHMMTKALEWDMIRETPFSKGKRLHLKENNVILRFLSEDEITSLLDTCSGNMTYLNDIITCAINTGMRKGEILSLKWSQIKNGQIYLTDTKGKKPRQVPVNTDLEGLFKRIRKREGLRSKYVFTYQGKPIADNVKNGFRSALKKADIMEFRFHDLRHTFASHFVMRGGDLKTLQEILGHSDIKTTMRYSHLSKAHKAKAINLVCGLTSPSKSSMSENVRNSVFSASSN